MALQSKVVVIRSHPSENYKGWQSENEVACAIDWAEPDYHHSFGMNHRPLRPIPVCKFAVDMMTNRAGSQVGRVFLRSVVV